MGDSQEPAPDTGRRIFRDAALERLNSPEQLDQRIKVIPPSMRLLAASTSVIILAALAWAGHCHVGACEPFLASARAC